MNDPVATARAREEFRRCVHRLLAEGEGSVRLAELAAWIEAEGRSVEVEDVLAALQALASRAFLHVGSSGPASDRVRGLVAFLSSLGFGSDGVDFDAPEGSFLGLVLETRRGLPLTVSVVFLDLARQLALPMEGLSTPGRFLLRSRGEEDLVIDPFAVRVVTDAECTKLFRSILGRDDVAFARERSRAATVREMVTRILVNLRAGYGRRAELAAALACTDRILLLWPDDLGELFRRGALYEQIGFVPSAIRDFERVSALAPDSDAAGAARERLEHLRRSVHSVH